MLVDSNNFVSYLQECVEAADVVFIQQRRLKILEFLHHCLLMHSPPQDNPLHFRPRKSITLRIREKTHPRMRYSTCSPSVKL